MGFFDISGDTIKAAEAAGSFNLAVPETAKKLKDGNAWTEHVRVKEASSEIGSKEIDGQKMEVLVLHLTLECDKQGSGLNEGKTFKANFRLNQTALYKGKGAPKGSQWQKQFTMTQMSIPRLKSVVRACGFAPDGEDGGFTQTFLRECFPLADDFSGVSSPLIGQAFWAEIKTSKSEKDGKTYTNYDIQNVLEDQG